MAWTEMAWMVILLVLVFLSLTVAPTWSVAFLILFGVIARSVVSAVKEMRKHPILPLFRRAYAQAVDAPALTDDAPVDGPALAVDATKGTRRQPEPSSISSSLSGFKYDVYLSFRRSDTRDGIRDCIYTKLADAGIRVFRGKGKLIKKKKEFWPALEEAIKQSRILIPILSRNYASSKLCLNELVQMWECMKLNGQTVLPIFYEVSPDDVRYQDGDFGESFSQHAGRVDSNTIETWREVLRQMATLRGYLGEKRNGPESLLAEEVFAGVVGVLNEDDQVVTDKLVGIDHDVEEMMSKLDVAYRDGQATEVRGEEVRVVVVRGGRGGGKTTLAKVVFNKTRKLFDAYSFLEGISSKEVQVSRRRLIADLQIRKPAPLESSGEEIEEMASLCRNVKVLIVLDDVDEDEQIRALAGNLAWFGPGSRIIVTTKKKNVLNAFNVEAVEEHPVKPMDQRHAHIIFCEHAFQGCAAPRVTKYYTSATIPKTVGRDNMKVVRRKNTLDLLQKKPEK